MFFDKYPKYSRIRRNRLGYIRTDENTFRQQANDFGVVNLGNVREDVNMDLTFTSIEIK